MRVSRKPISGCGRHFYYDAARRVVIKTVGLWVEVQGARDGQGVCGRGNLRAAKMIRASKVGRFMIA